MERKLNKKKIILAIIFLLLIIMLVIAPTFSRYVYNNIRDTYLKSKNYSFTSNYLTVTNENYSYSNWSGVESYEIDFELYSYENELSLFTYDDPGLEYTITCTVDETDKATAHIDSINGEDTQTSYIPNDTNRKSVKILLVATESLKQGDTVTLRVKASTTVPYKKTLSATIKVRVSSNFVSYRIEDKPSRIYATLKLINVENAEKQLKLTFDPSLLRIDTSDECYINGKVQSTKKVSGVEYVSSVTITLKPEHAKDIKFYKTNPTEDYTYPGGSYDKLIINVE